MIDKFTLLIIETYLHLLAKFVAIKLYRNGLITELIDTNMFAMTVKFWQKCTAWKVCGLQETTK